MYFRLGAFTLRRLRGRCWDISPRHASPRPKVVTVRFPKAPRFCTLGKRAHDFRPWGSVRQSFLPKSKILISHLLQLNFYPKILQFNYKVLQRPNDFRPWRFGYRSLAQNKLLLINFAIQLQGTTKA